MVMDRGESQLFSSGRIAGLTLPNRFVRSSTADSRMYRSRQVADADLDVYRALARGGVGLIVTGGFNVTPSRLREPDGLAMWDVDYEDVRIDGVEKLVDAVRAEAPEARIVAQLQTGGVSGRPSSVPSPFSKTVPRELTLREIGVLIEAFVLSIVEMKRAGFDGAQLHAGHGALLSRFFSTYTNCRHDAFGGSIERRVRMAREIVDRARQQVGDYPILIKVNATDCLEGGTDLASFPALATELERIGFDAIEITGGMWECLARPQEELGFRPVPAPESRTRIGAIENQSYFLPYAEALDLDIPVILSGGNRNVDRLDEILRSGAADFGSMCRPLIREPDLVNRWREGRGDAEAACIACNSCIYALWHLADCDRFATTTCLFEVDESLHREAQQWLTGWVEKHRVDGHSS